MSPPVRPLAARSARESRPTGVRESGASRAPQRRSNAGVGAACLVALLLWAAAVPAQPRVGLLYASSTNTAVRVDAFRSGLAALGYVDGKNVHLDVSFAEGELSRFAPLAVELVRRKSDVLVSGGLASTRALRAASTTIPIVMTQDNDPVGLGFVASLARPGGNVTGLSSLGATIASKQLALLKEVMPGLARVAVIGSSNSPANSNALAEARRIAPSLAVEIEYLDVLVPDGYEAAFRAAAARRVEAVLLLRSPVAAPRIDRLGALAIEHRLATMFPHEAFVVAGGLMSYSTIVTDLDRRAAGYVDRILRGAKPADLPVEQPAKFELLINLRTAHALGLRIPPSVRLKADRVID